jgi:hypothetical protein
MMALFTRVFVRTSSLLEALYTCNGRISGTVMFMSYKVRNTHNANEASLACDMLGRPCEVPRLQTESSILNIATTSADTVDTFRSEPCIGGLATEFELSLFAVVRALSARCRSLVPRGASDT